MLKAPPQSAIRPGGRPEGTRIRIVHLIDNTGVGGTEASLYRIATAMDRERFETVVISMMECGANGTRIIESGIPVYELGMPASAAAVPKAFKLIRLLRTLRTDLLQTWAITADMLGTLVAPLAGVRRVVWNVRNSALESRFCSRKTLLARRLCAPLSRYPIALVANSEAGRADRVAAGYRSDGWRVIPNGFDTGLFRPDLRSRSAVRAELRLSQEDVLIGIVGRHHPTKDHATFIRAARILHATRPSARYVMIGEGLTSCNRPLSELIRSYGLADSILLLGIRHDVPRLLAALDVFSLTSITEGFPNVLGEAMASGLPCTSPQGVGDCDLLLGDTGLRVPPGDAQALAACWETLVTMGPERRHELGAGARSRILSRFRLDTIVGEYEELYYSLMNP